MSKVIFVVPVYEISIRQECRGTLLLATILKQKGIDVDIYRFFQSNPDSGFNNFLTNSIRNILAKDPVIVSFYCRGDCYLANIMIAKKIKEIRPDIHIVFGGPQADISAKETINQIPWVDYCCSGEGETTIYPFFNALLKGEDISSVPGLTYRSSEGEVVSNPRPELIKNLDELPFIDYSMLPVELTSKKRSATASFLMEVGRGCPFNCIYCSTSIFWQRNFRLKSAERIITEIKIINDTFGITTFTFDHDLFTASKKQVLKFCHTLKETKMPVIWSCSSRADTIDKEMIEEMASAGMYSIYLGVETGSERMQNIIHKKLNIQKTINTIKCLVDNGVKVTVSFIYGFPEETYEDLEDTLQMVYLLYSYGVTAFQFHLCSISSGTEYYDIYKDKLVWAEKFSDQTGDFGVKECLDFVQSHKELFPFYYEYQSDLRTRLYGMDKTIMMFMQMYHRINKLDPEKFAGKRIVDLYLDFKDTNKKFISENIDDNAPITHKLEMINNYLSTVYDTEKAEILKEVFAFRQDLIDIKNKKEDSAEVKVYNIDINDVINKKPLKDIKKRTSMVRITSINKKTSCNVQYLT